SSDGAFTSSVVTTAFGDVMYSGIQTSSAFTYSRWEVTEESNLGLSARLFNSNLSVELDYFRRDTKDAVIPVARPLVPESLRQNVGQIRNQGFEVALNWTKVVNDDFSYSIGGNVATLDDGILDLGGQQYLKFGS